MDGRLGKARNIGSSREPAGGGFRAVRWWGILSALLVAAPAQAQFGAYPVIMNFGAGAPATQTLTLLSEDDEPVTLRLYLGDFEQMPEGTHEFGQLGAHPMSCSGRLRISPESVTLDPGQEAEVQVTVDHGPDPCWSAVFAERALPGEGVQVNYRIAIKVHGNPDVAIADARMVDVHVEPCEGGLEAVMTLDNTGVMNLRPEGSLDIRTMTGEVERSLDILPFSVLPGHRRIVRILLPDDLPPGAHLAIPIVDIGRDFLLGGQTEFQVSGTSER